VHGAHGQLNEGAWRLSLLEPPMPSDGRADAFARASPAEVGESPPLSFSSNAPASVVLARTCAWLCPLAQGAPARSHTRVLGNVYF
jgi:hypothetical protein